MEIRYDMTGPWYKGNTHLHTTASDGGKATAEVAELYAAAGYQFLFVTDHWRSSDLESGATQAPLLWFDGMELDGRDEAGHLYHIVCLGKTQGITRDLGFIPAVESAQAQGAMLVLAHPFWSGNTGGDLTRFAFDGVEIHNHVCNWLNGKGDGRIFWNELLSRRPGVLGLAADDAHLRQEYPGWNGGWIVVNAPELSRPAIWQAIHHGQYYSSAGPAYHRIVGHGNEISITTSPVQFVRLVGPAFLGKRLGSFGPERLTEATFTVPRDWAYAYIEIEDDRGRRAWTNNLISA